MAMANIIPIMASAIMLSTRVYPLLPIALLLAYGEPERLQRAAASAVVGGDGHVCLSLVANRFQFYPAALHLHALGPLHDRIGNFVSVRIGRLHFVYEMF